jgi:hypothetical protein
MRLLDQLIQKRDHHLALAGKFADLIAVLQGDEDLIRVGHKSKLSMMRQAQTLHGNGNGNGNGHATVVPEKKPRYKLSLKQRQAMADRMRKLWKEKRPQMLRGVHKGHRNAVKVIKAKAKAKKSAPVTTTEATT